MHNEALSWEYFFNVNEILWKVLHHLWNVPHRFCENCLYIPQASVITTCLLQQVYNPMSSVILIFDYCLFSNNEQQKYLFCTKHVTPWWIITVIFMSLTTWCIFSQHNGLLLAWPVHMQHINVTMIQSFFDIWKRGGRLCKFNWNSVILTLHMVMLKIY